MQIIKALKKKIWWLTITVAFNALMLTSLWEQPNQPLTRIALIAITTTIFIHRHGNLWDILDQLGDAIDTIKNPTV